MNAKDSRSQDYGDADIDELESAAGGGRAAPIAIAVASVVVVAAIIAAWFFAIAPVRRDAPRPVAQDAQSESVARQEPSAAARIEQSAAPQSAGGQAGADGSEAGGAETAREGSAEAGAQPAAETPGEGAPAEAAPAPALPSFDTVRVESSGDAVLAGQALPGANVKLFAGTEQIGETLADGGGNWALVLDKPLPAGTSDLWISAAGNGKGETRSHQSVAIVIDPNRQASPLVVVQDSLGSRVLQQAEQQVAEAPPAPEATADADARDGAHARSGAAEGAAAAEGAPEGAARAEAPAEAGMAPIVIEAADYTESGELHISGSAAPNATVRLYYDDAHAGDALADDQGRWSLSLKRELDGAVHSVRADDIESRSGSVRTRAEVSFIAKLSPEQERELSQRIAARAEQAGEHQVAGSQPEAGESTVQSGTATSEAEPAESVSTAASGVETAPAVASAQTGAGEGSAPSGQAVAAAMPADDGAGSAERGRITIVRGDNLWRIAREHYGRGIRYTAIFQANKEQIRDPNLIYPGQVFLIPRLQDTN